MIGNRVDVALDDDGSSISSSEEEHRRMALNFSRVFCRKAYGEISAPA